MLKIKKLIIENKIPKYILEINKEKLAKILLIFFYHIFYMKYHSILSIINLYQKF